MMSGNTLDQWSLTRNPRKTAFELGVALGIHTNSSDILISQMRLLAAATISLKSYALLYSRVSIHFESSELIFTLLKHFS